MTEEQLKIELERFIDSNSFYRVVDLLTEIADEKAQHLRENWQDKTRAKEYDRLSNKLFTLQSGMLREELTF
jgi:hypothetical protein